MGRALAKGEWVLAPFLCEIRLGPTLRPQGHRHAVLAQIEAAVRALQAET